MPSRRTDDTTGGTPHALPLAPGTDALRRRLEQGDPPSAVVVLGVDVRIRPEHDPRGRADVAVLEMPAAANPARINWRAVAGLEVVLCVDGLSCSTDEIVTALRDAGALHVEAITGPIGPGGDR